MHLPLRTPEDLVTADFRRTLKAGKSPNITEFNRELEWWTDSRPSFWRDAIFQGLKLTVLHAYVWFRAISHWT